MRLRFVFCILFATLLGPRAAGIAAEPPRKLTSAALDALLDRELGETSTTPLTSDEDFLRRLSFDLIGRQPSYGEFQAFENDHQPDKRARAIDRLLSSPSYGRNWANFWSDTISYRVAPPTKIYLSYDSFKAWFADRLNKDAPWNEITRQLLTATGQLAEHPEATFIGFHQGQPAKLTTEVSRIFLGVNIQCAECHDHPFDDWKRKQFHQMAAFFGRLDADTTEVLFNPKGVYAMPDAKDAAQHAPLKPVTFTGETMANFADPKADPRIMLADWITAPKNPWFAKAFVNRVWTELTGKGFYESVDNMSSHAEHSLPAVHQALADHFVASGYDIKSLFRLILNTEAYQRQVSTAAATKPFAAAAPARLRGDEIYQELVVALGLPAIKAPGKTAIKLAAAKITSTVLAAGSSTTAKNPALKNAGSEASTAGTKASSTKDGGASPIKTTSPLPPVDDPVKAAVNDRFGYDPSLRTEQVPPTIGQALLLMNRGDLQEYFKADPASGSPLSKLLQTERDDRKVAVHLYEQVLAREPTPAELQIVVNHVRTVGQRGAAFEDLLWSLINSTEFTTKR